MKITKRISELVELADLKIGEVILVGDNTLLIRANFPQHHNGDIPVLTTGDDYTNFKLVSFSRKTEGVPVTIANIDVEYTS